MKKQIYTSINRTLFLLLFITALSINTNAQLNSQRADIVKAFKDFPNSKHKDFIAKVFDCDENKKLHEFTLLLTYKGFIQFGSNPKVVGRENIEKMLVGFNKNFKHLSQHIIKVFNDTDSEIVYSAEATYSYDDGTVLKPLPYMVHLRFMGEEVSEYIIYIDLAPFNQHLLKMKGKSSN